MIRYSNGKQNNIMLMNTISMSETIFTTQDGVDLLILSISTWVKESLGQEQISQMQKISSIIRQESIYTSKILMNGL